MFSQRFKLPLVISAHAEERMVLRQMSEDLPLDVIETVDKDAGAGHHWLYKHYIDRNDNLHCVAAVVDNVFFVKAVMHDWEIAP